MTCHASQFEAVNERIIERVSVGATLADAAREEGVAERTVRGWLTRGRQNHEGKYAEFAGAFDQIRRQQNGPPLSEFLRKLPDGFTKADLLACVEEAARAGSFQGLKQLLKMRPDLKARLGETPMSAPRGHSAPRCEKKRRERRMTPEPFSVFSCAECGKKTVQRQGRRRPRRFCSPNCTTAWHRRDTAAKRRVTP